MARDVDLCAFAGTRVYGTFTARQEGGGVTAVNHITTSISQLAQSVDWTLEATSTDGGGRVQHTLTSFQSPWWDENVTPPDDYSGKMRLVVGAFANSSNVLQASSINGTFTHTNLVLLNTASGVMYQAIINPFGGTIIRKNDTSEVGNNNVMWGVLNQPRFVQEPEAGGNVKECFFICNANRFRSGLILRVGAGSNFFCYVDGTRTSTIDSSGGNNSTGAQFITKWHGNLLGSTNGIQFPNMVNDPTFIAPSLWNPIVCPTTFAWGGQSHSAPLYIRGWVYDMIVMTKANTAVDARWIHPSGHTFMAITNDPSQANRPCLWVCVSGTDPT